MRLIVRVIVCVRLCVIMCMTPPFVSLTAQVQFGEGGVVVEGG